MCWLFYCPVTIQQVQNVKVKTGSGQSETVCASDQTRPDQIPPHPHPHPSLRIKAWDTWIRFLKILSETNSLQLWTSELSNEASVFKSLTLCPPSAVPVAVTMPTLPSSSCSLKPCLVKASVRSAAVCQVLVNEARRWLALIKPW